jgi:tetratricopeptide (TPR) repeat protein
MNRNWINALCYVSGCLLMAASMTSMVSAEGGGKSLPVHGETVDAEGQAAYRLPLIGLCDPAEEGVVTGESGAISKAPAKPDDATVSGGGDAKPQAAEGPRSGASLAIPPTSGALTTQLLPAVQRGYNLAQRGAFFAARTEFIQVLRRIAQAKDAAAGTDEHSRELAAGLRAMDEADDFVPLGAQLEAELDLQKVASAHRTPVLHGHTEPVLPQDAVALYHSYAQEQLSKATVDERAGSMALYGLGKVYARLAERRDDDVQYVRCAMTMYCASLDACPDNNLAANELGVLLCRTGHPAEAVTNFVRAIDTAPSATAYHNLAVAQQKLGMAAQGMANEQESQRLTAMDRATGAISKRAGVQWVSPEELARCSQPAALGPATASEPMTASRPAAATPTTWR